MTKELGLSIRRMSEFSGDHSTFHISTHMWKLVVAGIVQRQTVLKEESMVNAKFMKIVLENMKRWDIGEEESACACVSDACRDIQKERIPFVVGIGLLDVKYKSTPLCESILFQSLFIWDILPRCFRSLAIEKIQKHANNTDQSLLLSLCNLDADQLLLSLFASRGNYFSSFIDCDCTNQLGSVLHPDSDRCKICPCKKNYHMNTLYETIASLSEQNQDNPITQVQAATERPEDFLMHMNTALLLVRKAALNVNIQNTVFPNFKPVRVVFKLTDKDYAVFRYDKAVTVCNIKNDGKSNRASLLECNHAKLVRVIMNIYQFKCADSMARTKCQIKPATAIMLYMDDDYIAIKPRKINDLVRLFEKLDNVIHAVKLRSEYGILFNDFISETCPSVPAVYSIEEKIRWLAFHILYTRYVCCYPEMSNYNSESQRFDIFYTYGMHATYDNDWRTAQDELDQLDKDLYTFHTVLCKKTADWLMEDSSVNMATSTSKNKTGVVKKGKSKKTKKNGSSSKPNETKIALQAEENCNQIAGKVEEEQEEAEEEKEKEEEKDEEEETEDKIMHEGLNERFKIIESKKRLFYEDMQQIEQMLLESTTSHMKTNINENE